MANIVLLGTCDTKLDEILYLRDEILREKSVEVVLIDVGRNEVAHAAINIQSGELRQRFGDGRIASDLPRREAIKVVTDCATKAVKELYDTGRIHGVVAAGGSGGTSLTAAVMRDALPIGFPKLIVSTVASGDTGGIVQETDMALMYSVVDIAGLNGVLRNVLSNAAAAIAGMARSYASREESRAKPSTKRVGITMFGVTTPAVDAIRKHLESQYDIECYVFHATGHGGKAMERLVREGRLDAVLDLTTTEICDLHTGGVMSAAPDRLEAAARTGIPNIISLGATDMTNFGPMGTVPEKYKDRKLYEHNPLVTLMRSSKEECKQVGDFIVKKLVEHAKNPDMIEVWMPLGGVSMIATAGGPFQDASADEVLFQTVRDGLSGTKIRVVEDARAINDPGFARDIAEALAQKMGFA
ncbi:uncharacterized protein EI97DRAFT_74023 [Westerdykella ornata]|uniref:Uncharacterized protein n=1 Tax=Westerdykella ornata TaxID=318751 RepID=A0A6A6JH28_WESOR|nr:uncharacterized protein EI97DRAFT_74023 [Westerdykella ornata]KAF2275413.1 hypothetical protein EI97DRAFT_74023 [Westerdykella ornata]